MTTWLALAFASLPLQLAQRALDPALARALALAIIDGSAQRARVLACNEPARKAGIVPGMKLAAAQALVRELVAVAYDSQREQSALLELAGWAYQFSAQVALFPAHEGSGLLIETGASQRLFGGRVPLRRRIVEGLRQLGYRAGDADAATPAAARLLARARLRTGAAAAAGSAAATAAVPALRSALARLPLELLAWEAPLVQTLHGLGLRTIGDLWALPRAAFARRFGAACLISLDRLLGTIPDPQALFSPPQRFRARLDLPADLSETAALLAPALQLLRLLEGFLRGQGAGATALSLRAHHSPRRAQPRPATTVTLSLALPERDSTRLLELLRERLDRVRLPDTAVALELELERMAAWTPVAASFLPPAPQEATGSVDALRLEETFHARLGPQGVFRLRALADHRPERAYRIVGLGSEDEAALAAPALPAQRPLWILPLPRRLRVCATLESEPRYDGPLDLLAGPERIEAGWWDMGATPQPASVQRDYFVARNRRGQTLWIYRELSAPHEWFLHGFFS
jgi:protein ImuB